jgi:caspase domain-containing protein
MKRLRLILATICIVNIVFANDVDNSNYSKSLYGGIDRGRSGDLWIVTIGINKYGYTQYSNCEKDAERFSQFFTSRFFNTDTLNISQAKRVHNYLILGDKASRGAILDALRNIVDSSKPQDYFLFNFAGVSVPLGPTKKELSERKGPIYFLPYGVDNPYDSSEVANEGISLKSLGSLFTLIPANNQLFFTEAGPTPEFRKEFINLVIEKNAVAAMLTEKKRVVMVPKGMGFDQLYCGGKINQGPLNYYLTQIPRSVDIFNLFGERRKADEVVFAIQTSEVMCHAQYTPYTEIFFERDYLEHVQQLTAKDEPLKRGGVQSKSSDLPVQEKRPGRKLAMVIATNIFEASDQWGNLPNPLNDAKAIGDTLQNEYGYKVEYLFNKTKKEIMTRLLSLPKELREDDQLIIYFAGHGDTSAILDDGYIVCRDSKTTEQDAVRETYIGFNGLARAINKFPPKQILVLLDVCFGGSFAERVAKRISSEPPPNTAESVLSQKLRLQTRKYISSGGLISVDDSDKKLKKHSPFAVVVLEALRTKGGEEKILTASRLYGFIQLKLSTGPLFDDFGDVNRGSEYMLVANTIN